MSATAVRLHRLGDTAQAPPVGDVLLVRIDGVARLCDLSPRTIRRMDAAGKLPRAVRVGGSKRWRVAEIDAWVAAGCPERSRWEAIRKERTGT